MGEVGCLRDERFQNLKVEKISSYRRNMITPLGTDTVLTAAHSGSVVFLNTAETNTVTLPLSSTILPGWHINVILTDDTSDDTAEATATGIIQNNAAEDLFTGIIDVVDGDGSTQTVTAGEGVGTITFKHTANACKVGAFVNIVFAGGVFYVDGFATHANASDVMTLD